MKMNTSPSNSSLRRQSRIGTSEHNNKKYLHDFVRTPDHTSVYTLRNTDILGAETLRERVRVSEQEKHLRWRYEEIERVLTEENSNLKKQAEFLAQEIRKSIKRDKKSKEQIKSVKMEFNALLAQNEQLAKTIQFLKELIAAETEALMRCLNMTGINQMAVGVREVINSFCGSIRLNVQPMIVEIPPLEIGKKSISTPLPIPIPIQNQEEEQIRSQIDGLNDKFEALMYEYRTSNRSEIRKQCIKIAKEIKGLKEKSHSKDTKDKNISKSNERASIYETNERHTAEYSIRAHHTDRQPPIRNELSSYTPRLSPQKFNFHLRSQPPQPPPTRRRNIALQKMQITPIRPYAVDRSSS